MIEHVKDPVIEVHDLTISYYKKPVLWNVDFTLPKGQLVGIVGPNGSGKTTLLKSIMGLMSSDSGYTKIFDQPLAQVRQQVSYVPQRESVDWDFPATVFDVALMGRYGKKSIFKRLSTKDKQKALEALQQVGLEELKDRQISQLSGGQQQRVFIARALAQEADLYIMDEPFAGVDASTENTLIELFKSMRDQGQSLVVVHHDLQSVQEYFDWLVLLNARLVASGPTEKVFTPDLLKAAYGGKLTMLTKVGQLLQEREQPAREETKA